VTFEDDHKNERNHKNELKITDQKNDKKIVQTE